MKKYILILLLLLPALAYSQDGQNQIGNGTIRYDQDSGYFKFSHKLARNNFSNALFDYDPAQFTWDASKGLSLLAYFDSLRAKNFTLSRDTTILGETKWKHWSLKRRFFGSGGLDSGTLYLYYSNELYSPSAKDSFHLLNKAIESVNDTANIVLTTSLQTITSIIIPHGGLWLLNYWAEYEYTPNTPISDAADTIETSLQGISNEEAKMKARHYYNNTDNTGSGSTMSRSYIINPAGSQTYNVRAKTSSNVLTDKKIRRAGITATLIR